MGILVISWNFPPRRGGIENVIGNLVAGLGERNPVIVITAHARTRGSGEAKIFRAPCPGLIPFAIYALWRGALSLLHAPRLSVVFGGSALATPLVLILARLFGRKAVVQTHGLDIIYANAVYQFLCVRWLKHCERIIANSTYTALLAKNAGVPENRIAVIPPGVYPQRFAASANVHAIKKQLGLEGKRVVLFVGRLAKRKGVKEFIERSLVNIVREIPEVCFVIVGDNPLESLTHRDDEVSDIKAVIARLRLKDRVRLLGAVCDEELIALYQMCDVVVLPVLAMKNDVEGFGIVLLEAAAAARPTVATRVDGIPDAIEDGKSGILVEPGDYEELSQALVELLRNDELGETLGGYGLKRVQENFAWEKIIASYEQALVLAVGTET